MEGNFTIDEFKFNHFTCKSMVKNQIIKFLNKYKNKKKVIFYFGHGRTGSGSWPLYKMKDGGT